MASRGETPQFTPDSEVPRIREYAEILSRATDIIELLESPESKPFIDQTEYSFETVQDFTIPEQVINKVGPLLSIDITLSLTTDILSSDADISPDYEAEPSEEKAFDILNQATPTYYSEKELARGANISVYLEGVNGTYVISRSSLPSETTHDEIIHIKDRKTNVESVEPVTQRDLNKLIFSIINPDTQNVSDENDPRLDANIITPTSFDLLNELFRLVALNSKGNITHQFKANDDARFSYYQGEGLLDDQVATYFRIYFTSPDDSQKSIIARSEFDTGLELSFETVDTTAVADSFERSDFSPKGPSVLTYTPTLAELRHLKALLKDEARALRKGLKPLDVINPDEIVAETTTPRIIEAIDTYISDDQDFNHIVTYDTIDTILGHTEPPEDSN